MQQLLRLPQAASPCRPVPAIAAASSDPSQAHITEKRRRHLLLRADPSAPSRRRRCHPRPRRRCRCPPPRRRRCLWLLQPRLVAAARHLWPAPRTCPQAAQQQRASRKKRVQRRNAPLPATLTLGLAPPNQPPTCCEEVASSIVLSGRCRINLETTSPRPHEKAQSKMARTSQAARRGRPLSAALESHQPRKTQGNAVVLPRRQQPSASLVHRADCQVCALDFPDLETSKGERQTWTCMCTRERACLDACRQGAVPGVPHLGGLKPDRGRHCLCSDNVRLFRRNGALLEKARKLNVVCVGKPGDDLPEKQRRQQ